MAHSCSNVTVNRNPVVKFCKESGKELKQIALAHKIGTVFLTSGIILTALNTPLLATVMVAGLATGFVLTKLGWALRDVKFLQLFRAKNETSMTLLAMAIAVTALVIILIPPMIIAPSLALVYGGHGLLYFLAGSYVNNENRLKQSIER